MMSKLLKRLSVFVFVFFVVSYITINHDGENIIVVDAMTLTTNKIRRDVLKIPVAAAATIGSAFVLAKPATITTTGSTSAVTTSTTTAEEDNNTKLPFPGSQKNIGVLWLSLIHI